MMDAPCAGWIIADVADLLLTKHGRTPLGRARARGANPESERGGPLFVGCWPLNLDYPDQRSAFSGEYRSSTRKLINNSQILFFHFCIDCLSELSACPLLKDSGK